ncbi:MAG TPA: VCBS repeat-containing protein [Roseimicrobium sp.]|nr:VCBS repeat-containing protein [Roseimicrobium sp.]
MLQQANGKSPARFVFAQQRTGQLEFFNLEPAKDHSEAAALRPRIFAPRATVKTPSAYAFGDFNGDGRDDVAVSDPDGAQVFIYFRQTDGSFTLAERYPTFSDARSIAAGDWDGKGSDSLMIASPKEQAVGIASINADGRLGYPQPLPTLGRPLAVAAGKLAGKDDKLSVVVLREDKGKRAFDIFNRGADGKPALTRSVEVNGLKTDPRGLRLVDANQDGRLDVAIFTPLDSMRLFVQAADGGFTEAGAATGFRKGLVDNLDASAVATGDLEGDGKAELIVSTGAFARAVRVDGQGVLTVLDQFNARDTTAEIGTAFVVPADKGKRPEVLLYDRKGEQFQRLRANAQGVYDVVDTVPAGKIDVVGSEMRFAGKGTKQPELFVLGKDRFWWLPLERGDFTARSVESYTTDLPDIRYSDVLAGDLTGGSQLELVAIDPDSNLIEVLAWDTKAKAWSSRLHFKVFETDQHYEGKKGSPQEPRESIMADVTGDGKKDLILLVHDRVLVYPQK